MEINIPKVSTMFRVNFRLAVGLIAWLSVHGESVQVIRGDQVNIPLPEECRTVDESTLTHRLGDATTRLVASFSRERGWRPSEDYSGRMNQSDSVVISPTNMNDNGLYEFSCSHKPVQLDVVEALAVRVSVNDTVRLRCHAVTAGRSVQSVRWEKGGDLVLQHSLTGTEFGKGFEKRAFMSADWLRTGDLSLTIEGAEPGDDGDYFCYIDPVKKRETPAAWRLTVLKEPGPHAPTLSPPPQKQTEQHSPTVITLITVITVAVTTLIVAPLGFLVGWKLKSRKCKHLRPGGGTTRDEEQRLEGGDDRGEEDDGETGGFKTFWKRLPCINASI